MDNHQISPDEFQALVRTLEETLRKARGLVESLGEGERKTRMNEILMLRN